MPWCLEVSLNDPNGAYPVAYVAWDRRSHKPPQFAMVLGGRSVMTCWYLVNLLFPYLRSYVYNYIVWNIRQRERERKSFVCTCMCLICWWALSIWQRLPQMKPAVLMARGPSSLAQRVQLMTWWYMVIWENSESSQLTWAELQFSD